MRIKGLTDEDFVNYKVPSMFIATATCDFKCDRECGRNVCQNSELAHRPNKVIPNHKIIERYKHNPITKAIILGGLEPMNQFADVIRFITELRDSYVTDDVVIYTGFTKDELENAKWDAYIEDKCWQSCKLNCLEILRRFENIIVKFGRYVPDQKPHFDPVLGVNLASDNQYAERIS